MQKIFSIRFQLKICLRLFSCFIPALAQCMTVSALILANRHSLGLDRLRLPRERVQEREGQVRELPPLWRRHRSRGRSEGSDLRL